jgi:hypothetical protein
MRTTSTLAGLVCVLMAGASGLGLFVDGLYRDNALVTAGWLGNDLVTLLLVVPTLAFTVAVGSRASSRGLLACLGLMAYALYDYAFYLFGAAFNAAFLLYVGIVTCATLGLIAGLTSPELVRAVAGLTVRTTHRQVGIVVAGVAGVLGLFWIVASAAYPTTGEVPAIVVASGHPTNVPAALDLWLVVTFGLLGGSWLARGRPWGYILSAVWAVKGAFYMLALSAASMTAFRAGALADLSQLGLWVPIGVVCTAAALVLLADVDPDPAPTT